MFCPSCGKELAPGNDRCDRCFEALPKPPAPADPMLGLLLEERYVVEEFISRGGMGAVYRGTDQSLGRKVAVKFLDERFRSDKEVVSRFHREALSAAALEHPNIIPIYGVGQRDGHHYFVMKYVEGHTVSQLVTERGRIPVPEALSIAAQVCEGLDHIHGRGYVHRDVKPTNVMLDARGHAFILDFGILRETTSDLTQTGFVAGTPEYMSPEQARSAKNTDARSDIYSLGVMLFEMLCGRRPFKADTAFDLLLKHVSEPPPALTSLVPELPTLCDELVLRALEKEPQRRYQTAREMHGALRRALALVENGAAFDGPRTRFDVPGPSTRPEAFPRAAHDSGTIRENPAPRSDVRATMIHGETELRLAGLAPRHKRLVAALMGAAVTAGIALIAYFVLRESPQQAAPSPRPVAAPRPQVAASGSNPFPTPMPFAPQTPAPTTSPAPVVASAATPAEGAPKEGADVERAPRPAVQKAPPKSTLSVRSTPSGATVYDGERRLGDTPVEDLSIAPGEHELVLNKDGYVTARRDVNLKPGSLEVVQVRLRRQEGKLSVIIRQGGKLSYAEVLLDGRSLGSAPVSSRKVAAGSHSVGVRRKGYRSETKVVEVGAGDTERVVFELQPQ